MIIRITCLFVFNIFVSVCAVAEPVHMQKNDQVLTQTIIHIGVLAFKGEDLAHQMWAPTAEYLSNEIQGMNFRIVPLTHDSIEQSISNGEIDFVLTNSASYASLEADLGISRIVTLKNRRAGGVYTRFGALIITRSDRSDINSLSDLKGKIFGAVHKNAFGGWWMAWRELKIAGIDPFKDFTKIEFSGFPMQKVITAISSGEIDAGTIRTDLLERLVTAGKVDISDFKVLNARMSQDFPFALSTRLYPEWPFAIVKHTSPELAQQVAISLLKMNPESVAALAAKSAGWTVPLDYQPVHDLMKELRVGPYKNLGNISILKVIEKYWQWIVLTAVLLLFLVGLSFYMLRLISKLKHSDQESLKQEKRIQALYDVESMPGLTFDEKITEVLRVGCNLLGMEIGRVNKIDVKNNKNIILYVFAPNNLGMKTGITLPLENTFCNITFKQNNGLVVNHAAKSIWNESACYKISKLEAYIAVLITVNGEHYGTLNYSSLSPRTVPFKQTDMDLVKLMGRRVSSILERRITQEEIIKAKTNAEDANKEKSVFLANMSHEIRTPLTAIIGFGESLLESTQTMEQRISSIKTIVRSGKHLLQIINDILDLSKVEARKLNIVKTSFSLIQTISEIDSLIQIQAKNNELSFNVDYKFPLPKYVYSEPLRLKQVLINLCSNAIKFTEKGSITLSVECDKEKLLFKVTDTGIGLEKQYIKKVFNPFSQVDSSPTRKSKGTGLGLSLSKELVEILGGKLDVKSKLGEGSTFYFDIHAGNLVDVEFADNIDQLLIDSSNYNCSIPFNKLSGNVLLVEDNVDNQVLIAMHLDALGANVQVVSDGLEAVNVTENNSYDLILMDMQMPVMDGLEAVSIIRQHGYKHAIAALTANAMKDDRKKCINAGCNDFITKPVSRASLYDVLSKYLLLLNEITQVDNSEITPIFSTLIEEDPDFIDLLIKFIHNLKSNIANINKAILNKDWETVKNEVHQIKGAGGGYGYPMVTELAAQLEFQILTENYKEVEKLSNDLYSMYLRLVAGTEGLRSRGYG